MTAAALCAEDAAFLRGFFGAVLRQDAAALAPCFTPDARVRWLCTNEEFTAAEYIAANCAYPGAWRGEIARLAPLPDGAVMAARVWNAESGASFHVASFFTLRGGRIAALDETWGDDGPAPAWRAEMQLGRAIRANGDNRQEESNE